MKILMYCRRHQRCVSNRWRNADARPSSCETGKPDLAFARQFAEAIHTQYPGKLLAYNCAPSFNGK